MDSNFQDRREAGRALAAQLGSQLFGADFLVLGLAPGGVPIAYEVARVLDLPLDVFVVRTLHATRQQDAAVGAIAAGGVRVLDAATIASLGVSPSTIDEIARHEALELARREQYYRARRQGPRITGRDVVLVDDGLTAPSVLRIAADALSSYHPSKLVVAVPIAPPELRDRLDSAVDALVSALPPQPVGRLYEDDAPVSDRDVRQLLTEYVDARLPFVERRAS